MFAIRSLRNWEINSPITSFTHSLCWCLGISSLRSSVSRHFLIVSASPPFSNKKRIRINSIRLFCLKLTQNFALCIYSAHHNLKVNFKIVLRLINVCRCRGSATSLGSRLRQGFGGHAGRVFPVHLHHLKIEAPSHYFIIAWSFLFLWALRLCPNSAN